MTDYQITGSLKVFANPSLREKDSFLPTVFVDSTRRGETFESILQAIRAKAAGGTSDISQAMGSYMDRVHAAPSSAKSTVDVEIVRHVPTTQFTVNTSKKLFIQNSLMPFYRAHRPTCNWAYPNYHSVNFFTCSNVPSDASWLYPNVRDGVRPLGCYAPTGSFTFEMWINPRHANEHPGEPFRAGTILHLSSSYALSLVSGSSRGRDGLVDGFRLLLQLSSSANVKPSLVTPGSGSGAYAYLSDDNVLGRGRWHHLLVTWGGSRSDQGTGSFYVDGAPAGRFVLDASTILGATTTNDVLCLGNFYEGNNAGANAQVRFFAADTSTRDGVHQLDPTTGVNEPTTFTFAHQLNAEVHDVSLREAYVSQARLQSLVTDRAPVTAANHLFYLPPFFVPGSPVLREVNGQGGLPLSPFHTLDQASDHPFSAPMSFGVAGRYNSLENFTKDFATGRFARVLNLTASTFLDTTPGALEANGYLYATASVRLRNLNVMPCDDGSFRPNFDLVRPFDLVSNPRFVDDIGSPDQGLISLRGMVTGSVYGSLYHQTGSMFSGIVGLAPEAGSLSPSTTSSGIYAVYQRTQDSTSNEVVTFDVSNLYYGERIRPGSLSVTDPAMSGSAGRFGVRLQDDGNGALFRADTLTAKATWNHVGNVFYEEGLILIKSPALPFFGAEGFDIEFEGEKSVHAAKFNVLLDATSYNTSSNTTWSPTMSASFDVNRDPENQKFVTISGVNFHDKNLNVLMRAQLAQPIVKRSGERVLLKIRYDF